MPRISTASPRASRNTRNGPSPLQTRISALLREARWILFAALAAWLTLVIATWSAPRRQGIVKVPRSQFSTSSNPVPGSQGPTSSSSRAIPA